MRRHYPRAVRLAAVLTAFGLFAGCGAEAKKPEVAKTPSQAKQGPAQVVSQPGFPASQPNPPPLQPPQANLQPNSPQPPPNSPAPTIIVTKKAASYAKAKPSPAPSPPSAAETPATSLPSAEAPKDEGYTVVQVYFATDRAPLDASLTAGSGHAPWLAWTLAAGGGTLISAALAVRRHRPRLTRAVALVLGGITFVLLLLTGYKTLAARPVTTGTDVPVAYGSERGSFVRGICRVAVPKSHEMGELESPSILKFEFSSDPNRDVTLLGVQPQAVDEFYTDMKSCLGRSQKKGILVFVHGFNVAFEEATRRTAQIAYDLKYDGAPVCYSWPSQGELLDYAIDETNVEWTVPHLKDFLTELAQRSGAQQIHLIAHSMGNRALTSALRYISYEPAATRPRFQEVILTAPDIDADVFRRDIAPAIVQTANRVTLYASSNDEALKVSQGIHGYPRAGDGGEQLVVVPGVDTIDVSQLDTDLIGHSYYGSSDTVLADLFDLVTSDKPPSQRKFLRGGQLGTLTYWMFERQ